MNREIPAVECPRCGSMYKGIYCRRCTPLVSQAERNAEIPEPKQKASVPTAEEAGLMDLVFEDQLRGAQTYLDHYAETSDPYLKETRLFCALQSLLLAVAALRNIEGMGSGSVASPMLSQAMKTTALTKDSKAQGDA